MQLYISACSELDIFLEYKIKPHTRDTDAYK